MDLSQHILVADAARLFREESENHTASSGRDCARDNQIGATDGETGNPRRCPTRNEYVRPAFVSMCYYPGPRLLKGSYVGILRKPGQLR